MMQLKIGKKTLKLKFAYKPTLKERIISKSVRLGNLSKDGEIDTSALEDFLLYIPEIILVGLQTYHKDEYGYNYDTKEGKEEQLDKVFALMDEYTDEGGDLMELFAQTQEEMKNDSFLSSIYAKAEKEEKNQPELVKAD